MIKKIINNLPKYSNPWAVLQKSNTLWSAVQRSLRFYFSHWSHTFSNLGGTQLCTKIVYMARLLKTFLWIPLFFPFVHHFLHRSLQNQTICQHSCHQSMSFWHLLVFWLEFWRFANHPFELNHLPFSADFLLIWTPWSI